MLRFKFPAELFHVQNERWEKVWNDPYDTRDDAYIEFLSTDILKIDMTEP